MFLLFYFLHFSQLFSSIFLSLSWVNWVNKGCFAVKLYHGLNWFFTFLSFVTFTWSFSNFWIFHFWAKKNFFLSHSLEHFFFVFFYLLAMSCCIPIVAKWSHFWLKALPAFLWSLLLEKWWWWRCCCLGSWFRSIPLDYFETKKQNFAQCVISECVIEGFLVLVFMLLLLLYFWCLFLPVASID